MKIPVDPARLAQVFDNLLTNAAKYAPGALITISLHNDDTMTYIVVSDEGPGISSEHLEYIFNRFYRVPSNSASVRGTGLGLFICRQIIRAHGGDIEVQSKIGKGTTFRICLPIEREQVEDQILLRESI
jgi:signal transduction histidine kinase